MEFKFLDPGKLIDNDLELVLQKTVPADPKKNYVPAYNFLMINKETTEKMGDIDLRIGYNQSIRYGGNIGYGVEEKFRGNHFASRSITLLLPFARKHGLTEITITCDPKNIASRKTCELSGGKLIEIVDLPKSNDQYKAGIRETSCVYKFTAFKIFSLIPSGDIPAKS
jgi:predicted acetyltransferase